VLVGGAVAERPSRMVAPNEPLVLIESAPAYVGRGGEKLAAAIEALGIDVSGAHALDAGASTGGFTDCLLQHGAASVVSLDVGRGQLHERLRSDPRVTVLERTNVRDASPASVGGPFDVVTADLSFISLRTTATALVGLVRHGGRLVVLIKPQFEVGRREASKGKGVIRDPELWRRAVSDVIAAFEGLGATMMGVMVSPLRGADGNVEFLAGFEVGGELAPPDGTEIQRTQTGDVDSVVAAAVALSESRS
jgi:23S rRNA (cytidine1920-2'-O)/16S rRNA (cytidine1409-2'-O)-methyltransferase